MSEIASPLKPAARPSPWLACLFVGLASVALYLPTLDSGFIAIDDPQYVTDNPYILHPTWQKFVGFFTEWEKPATVAGYYQPLTLASLMVDRLIERGLSGDWPMPPRPFVYHFSNLVIHGLNSALVCLIAFGLTRNRLAAVLCGLLFGVHPLNVEAVAWVNQRKALLSTLFAILMVLAHVRYARTRRGGWAIATFLAFLLSLLAKPTGLLLPVVLVLADVWPLRRFSARSIIEKIPLFLLSIVLGYVAYRSQHLTTGLSQNVAEDDPWRALLVMCHNLSFYIAKMFIPIRLSPFYRLPPDAEIALSNPSFLLGLIGAAGVGALMLLAMRRGWRSVWVCIAAFILMAAPALGSVRFMAAIAADRFAYMPMIAGLVLLAHGLRRRVAWDRIERRSGFSPSMRLMTVVSLLFVVPWSIYSVLQQRVWQSSRTYYGAIVARYPDGADGEFGLGVCCFEEHDQLMQAGLAPEDPTALALLEEADRHFRTTLERDPNFSKARTYVAEILLLRNRPDEARQILEKALAEGSGDEEAHFFLGTAMARMGDHAAAVAEYRRYLNVRPGSRETLLNLGNALVRLGRPREAIEYYARLFELDPDDPAALHNFGGALLSTKRADASLYPLSRAVELRSARVATLTGEAAQHEVSLLADSQYVLACALVELGREADAIKTLHAAVRNKPALLESVARSPTLKGIRESDAWKQLVGVAPASAPAASP